MATQLRDRPLRSGGEMRSPVFRLATSPAAVVAGKERTLRFCFSDGSLDRAGDTIDPAGWELDGFLANPVALWAHDSFSPPIGRAVNVGLVGKRLMGDIDFAPPETYEFADTIYRLAKGGFINAVSVGFNPLEWGYVNEPDRPYGIDFKRQELLEISLVPVPCNENALAEARAKGIDTRALERWADGALGRSASTEAVLRASVRATLAAVAASEYRSSANEDELRVALRRRRSAERI